MLTIEELKALPVGDWVWIEDEHEKTYWQIAEPYWEESKDGLTVYDSLVHHSWWKPYSTYGTKWLAYKNKEEAEGKSITLPYLLCTSSKFACVIWRDKDGKVHKTYTMPIEEAKRVLEEKRKIQWKD